ncbi:MAG: type II secretion system protein [Planctomycetota bacterium]
MSRAGFTLLELLIAIGVIAVLLAIAIPGFLQARKHANEASAIESLHAIAKGQTSFREGDRERDGLLDFGMLSELAFTQDIERVLGTGTKHGYLFEATRSFEAGEFLWFATARPISPGYSGDRFFAINHDGIVYYKTTGSFGLDTSTCLLPNGSATGTVTPGSTSGNGPGGGNGGNGNGGNGNGNGNGGGNGGNGNGGSNGVGPGGAGAPGQNKKG